MAAIENRIRSEDEIAGEIALLTFAYSYRSLNDKDLGAAARYCETPAAQWFRDAVRKGLERAVYETGRALARALSPQHPSITKPGRHDRGRGRDSW